LLIAWMNASGPGFSVETALGTEPSLAGVALVFPVLMPN
jgi:hypothetical protein